MVSRSSTNSFFADLFVRFVIRCTGRSNVPRVSCAARAAEAISLSYPRQLHPMLASGDDEATALVPA